MAASSRTKVQHHFRFVFSLHPKIIALLCSVLYFFKKCNAYSNSIGRAFQITEISKANLRVYFILQSPRAPNLYWTSSPLSRFGSVCAKRAIMKRKFGFQRDRISEFYRFLVNFWTESSLFRQKKQSIQSLRKFWGMQ